MINSRAFWAGWEKISVFFPTFSNWHDVVLSLMQWKSAIEAFSSLYSTQTYAQGPKKHLIKHGSWACVWQCEKRSPKTAGALCMTSLGSWRIYPGRGYVGEGYVEHPWWELNGLSTLLLPVGLHLLGAPFLFERFNRNCLLIDLLRGLNSLHSTFRLVVITVHFWGRRSLANNLTKFKLSQISKCLGGKQFLLQDFPSKKRNTISHGGFHFGWLDIGGIL